MEPDYPDSQIILGKVFNILNELSTNLSGTPSSMGDDARITFMRQGLRLGLLREARLLAKEVATLHDAIKAQRAEHSSPRPECVKAGPASTNSRAPEKNLSN